MEGVAGLVGGALLGAVAGELLKEVRQAKATISSFQTMFQRLETTLISIIPSVDAIVSLSHKLDDIQQHKLEELEVILRDGKSLVLKCRQTSRISYLKKLQYGKELTDLNDRLKDYLTLLTLDHFRNGLEMLNLMRDVHSKHVPESPTALPDDKF